MRILIMINTKKAITIITLYVKNMFSSEREREQNNNILFDVIHVIFIIMSNTM